VTVKKNDKESGDACCAPNPAKQSGKSSCCPSKPALRERPLLSYAQSGDLAVLFKVLANDTRLRILHALARGGELTPGALAEAVGMKAQAVSNQLQRLLDRGILATRREGNYIHYRIADRCVTGLLDLGLCLMEEARVAGSRRPKARDRA
jgi:ArsR family transcriptional regulator, lead/cadmium/zinc/bismuth-responsive transcriptional repressor